MRNCPNCGCENNDQAVFCKDCNFQLRRIEVVDNETVLVEASKVDYSVPWLSIWTEPRITIRRIINGGSTKFILLLAISWEIVFAFSRASSQNIGDRFPFHYIILTILFVGSIGGIIHFYIFSFFIHWIAGKLGGKAKITEVREAIAWSYVPYVVIFALWLFRIFIYGDASFKSDMTLFGISQFWQSVFFLFTIIDIILEIWGLWIIIQCLSEVNLFSSGKAFLSLLLSNIIIGIGYLIIFFGIINIFQLIT